MDISFVFIPRCKLAARTEFVFRNHLRGKSVYKRDLTFGVTFDSTVY